MEKLRVLLPHWIDHNREHGREFAKWAGPARAAGHTDVARLLEQAAASLLEADTALRAALHKSGGELHGRHHHNLPE